VDRSVEGNIVLGYVNIKENRILGAGGELVDKRGVSLRMGGEDGGVRRK
jgi:hypothetical protein